MAGRQIRHGTKATLPTLSEGELDLCTDTRELYVGSSVGDIRIHGDYVTPEMYGAVGDGVTDDTAAIQAAIDSLPGIVEPTNLVSCTPGGTVLLSAKTYGITSRLLVTKSNTHIIGQGSASTIIKYIGAANINELIRFRGTNFSALSKLMLHGAGTATTGTDACVTFDLAAYFYSSDLYCHLSRLYGIRAIHLWESYFDNLHIRDTGLQASVAHPSAGICFTGDTQEETTFAGSESNNTVFIKPTLVPGGCLVSTVSSAGNMTFISPITETTSLSTAVDATKESKWKIGTLSGNFKIIGGMFNSNAQASPTNSVLFEIDNSSMGLSINNYSVAISNINHPSDYPEITSIFKCSNYYSMDINDILIFDYFGYLDSVFDLSSGTFSSRVYGHLTYITEEAGITEPGLFLNTADYNLFCGVVTFYGSGTFSQASHLPLPTGGDSDDIKTIIGVAGLPATSGIIQNGILRLSSYPDSASCDFGISSTNGYSWIQAVLSDNLANNRGLLLNPNGGDVGIGLSDVGSFVNTEKALCLGTGTAPVNSPVDGFKEYSADITAGNAAPHFRTENGTIIKLDQAIDTTATPSFAAVKVGANQVVGAQGVAVADATDATSVILRLNELLARCRAHGIIAT